MNNLLKAAKLHYESRRLEALAHLEIYFTNSVGIGEHSDLLAEIKKWTEVLANAEDCHNTLEQFGQNGNMTNPQLK